MNFEELKPHLKPSHIKILEVHAKVDRKERHPIHPIPRHRLKCLRSLAPLNFYPVKRDSLFHWGPPKSGTIQLG
jgi:hypothetical protein